MLRSRLLALFVALTLTGCAASRPPSSPPPAPAATPSPTPAAEQPPPPEAADDDALPTDWHLLDEADAGLPGAAVEKAYEIVLHDRRPQREVVVAVIDSGVDIEHEDLQGRIWVNEDEVPDNGIDDDENGYVDDIHGWNFIGGADGRNVNYDSMELTRLFAPLHARFGEIEDAEEVPGDDRGDYERYLELRADYEAEVTEMYQNYQSLQQFIDNVEIARGILEQQEGVEAFDRATLEALEPSSQNAETAKSILLYMLDIGFTEEMLAEQLESVEGRLRYGLDPEFDPRPIVGDDPDDLYETGYGNNDVEGPDAMHGTHVAGIIAAVRDNGIGMDGVAPNAQIMVLRAVPNGDERDKDVANAIRYAVDNGAHLVNMSFGKGYSPHRELVEEAIRYAEERGVLLVHGAGNDAADLDVALNFPTPRYLDGTRASNWLEVGASSWAAPLELAASFTNYGRTSVDLFAPGVDIYSTVPQSDYRLLDGTSMAAPLVTGVAALLMAYFPDLTALETKALLLETAVPYVGQVVALPGGDEESSIDFGVLSVTGGIVNALQAAQKAEAMTP